jgi:twitching motility protein PilT
VLSVALSSVISQTLMPKAGGKGRVAGFEIMHNTPAIANLVREGKTERITSVIQTCAKLGMITLDDHILLLYRKGTITGEVALERSQNREEMRKNMMGEGLTGSGGEASADAKMAAVGATNNAPSEEY